MFTRSESFITLQLVIDWEFAERQRQRSRPRMVRRVVALNEYGKRIGETHHNARIPDRLVDQIRDLHEDAGMGYVSLAKRFNLSKNTIRKICTYERRAQTPVRYITIMVEARNG